MSILTNHISRWSSCEACELCKRRRNTVHIRGTIPCEALFIGEAPGYSEDSLAIPFVGPAGKKQDHIIAAAVRILGREFTYALCNLIACIPLDEDRTKVGDPPEESVKACLTRLEELVAMAQPRIIFMVGGHSQNWVPKFFGYDHAEKFVGIIHPASILRMNVAQQGLAEQRVSLEIADALEE